MSKKNTARFATLTRDQIANALTAGFINRGGDLAVEYLALIAESDRDDLLVLVAALETAEVGPDDDERLSAWLSEIAAHVPSRLGAVASELVKARREVAA